jgi:hypothetical protein
MQHQWCLSEICLREPAVAVSYRAQGRWAEGLPWQLQAKFRLDWKMAGIWNNQNR